MNPYITNQNDLFIYFEVIRQLRAKNVLDIGMTLKRSGAISRQIADSSIQRKVHLTGVDLFPEICIPVYNIIYNQILSKESFSKELSSLPHFTLATLLCLPECPLVPKICLPFLKCHADYILISKEINQIFLSEFSQKNVRSIRNGQNEYYLLQNI